MEEKEKSCPMNPHKSKIGGQALIEGVMMKGAFTGAMACRLPDGTIDVETWELDGKKKWYRKIPFVRGVYAFIFSMIDGYRCLMKSAEKQMTEEEEEGGVEDENPSKLELWLDEHFTEKTVEAIMMVFMVISMVLMFGAFFFLPKWFVSLFPVLTANRVLRSFSEGIIKIIIFVAYMAISGFMKDIRRTYEYHGAEHKTIACFEAGLELTVENVKNQIRLHPRCGTSFIFLTLLISILVMCLVPFTVVWQRFVCSILLLPVVVGVSFETIQLAGRHNNVLTRIISFPGLQLQRITTKEPSESQIEVAIAALTPCIPENLEDDKW